MILDRTFCMEVGQVKSGTGPEDTFHKMLQHIRGVTPQIADAVTVRWKTVSALIYAFRRGGSDILQHCVVSVLGNMI
jgi:crossover junction endonuclease EME1